jgi:hypothetical protein
MLLIDGWCVLFSIKALWLSPCYIRYSGTRQYSQSSSGVQSGRPCTVAQRLCNFLDKTDAELRQFPAEPIPQMENGRTAEKRWVAVLGEQSLRTETVVLHNLYARNFRMKFVIAGNKTVKPT